MNKKQKQNIIEHLAKTNTYEYNLLKTAEECTELSDVILKKILKKGGLKEPPDMAVIEEIGDVIIRIKILSHLFDMDAIDERVTFKLSKYKEYIHDGKYKSKI